MWPRRRGSKHSSCLILCRPTILRSRMRCGPAPCGEVGTEVRSFSARISWKSDIRLRRFDHRDAIETPIGMGSHLRPAYPVSGVPSSFKCPTVHSRPLPTMSR